MEIAAAAICAAGHGVAIQIHLTTDLVVVALWKMRPRYQLTVELVSQLYADYWPGSSGWKLAKQRLVGRG